MGCRTKHRSRFVRQPHTFPLKILNLSVPDHIYIKIPFYNETVIFPGAKTSARQCVSVPEQGRNYDKIRKGIIIIWRQFTYISAIPRPGRPRYRIFCAIMQVRSSSTASVFRISDFAIHASASAEMLIFWQRNTRQTQTAHPIHLKITRKHLHKSWNCQSRMNVSC